MRNCFVPLCDIQCKMIEKRMMFLPPKDPELFEKWKENLPKKRPFKRNDRVCERHFQPEDVIKTWEHKINGQIFHLERGKPRLRPNAIPCRNFPKEEEIDEMKKKKALRRAASVAHIQSPAKKRRKEELDVIEDVEQAKLEVGHNEIVQDEERVMMETLIVEEEQRRNVFTSIYDEIYEIILPSLLWGIHRDPEHDFFAFTCFDAIRQQAIKVIHIDTDLNMTVRVKGVVVSSDQLDYNTVSTDYISAILSEIDDQVMCEGESERCVVYAEKNSHYCSYCDKDLKSSQKIL
uniref:THAP-type domain-containing protein n=1 Tax=Nyssomyia neivai TaxID=330878 RepID=A0A1L8DD22_9DIPT